MFDPQLIATLLADEWSEADPAVADVTFSVDEYDPKKPALQIVCENADLPKENFVVGAVFKTIQPVRITVLCKPIRYAPDTMVTAKAVFYRMLAEVDKIIRASHFAIAAKEYNAISWRSVSIPKGMGAQPDPLVFTAEKLITVTEYI